MFLEIQELDPRITAKEVKNMSMKEMRDLLKELSRTDQEKPEDVYKRQGMWYIYIITRDILLLKLGISSIKR